MRVFGAGFCLSLAAWLVALILFGGLPSVSHSAYAQSLTPLAGQPRVTAPGGTIGRGLRRHKRHGRTKSHRRRSR